MTLLSRCTRWIALLTIGVACAWTLSAAAASFNAKPAAQTHTVMISGFKYQPDSLTVNVGDTIEWKNEDIVPHTVTAVNKSFNSGAIKPHASWKYVAKKAGTFPYGCTPHPNMHGTLIVK